MRHLVTLIEICMHLIRVNPGHICGFDRTPPDHVVTHLERFLSLASRNICDKSTKSLVLGGAWCEIKLKYPLNRKHNN